jgi:VWFA-related protein
VQELRPGGARRGKIYGLHGISREEELVPSRCVRLAALVLLGAVPALAQTTPAERPTFRTGVDLVRFDVRVTDDNGRPVTDLRPEELQIHDGGKLLPIVLFQRITEPAGAFVDAALRAVTAEVSSNEAFPRGHLYILLFDQQHITPGNEQRARMAAEQFIRTRVRPSDRVALFAVPGPGPQIGFTADKMRVLNELPKVRGSYQRVVTTALGTMSIYEAHRINQGDERLMQEVTSRMASEAGADVVGSGLAAARSGAAVAAASEDASVARRVARENARGIISQTDAESRQFLQRLADVIAGFRDIEGRKTVILFSEGFFPDNLTRELETVAAAAAQSYCVFYAFDLNNRGPSVSEAYASETGLATEIQSRIAPMSTLAVETDGMLVLDASARTPEALDLIARQAQDYYLVGFTPSDEARLKRGEYRRITIKTSRPGARVSARTGYTVAPERTLADRRRAIDSVLGAPFAQQGLKVDYTTYVMKAPEAGRHRVVLTLAADLPVRGKPTDTADVVFVARDIRDGRVVASGTDAIPLPGTARKGSPMGAGAWRVQFTVPAGSYMMRTVVREPGGLVGSADRRIDVRPLDGAEVAVSDLVLGSAESALPVRPRAFAGDGLSGVIEAYGRTAVQMENLEVRIQLKKPGEEPVVKSFDVELSDAAEDTTGITRRARFVMPLDGVSPGDYIAYATVKARGEIVAERTRHVEILTARDPTSPAEAPAETISPGDVVRGELGRRYVDGLHRAARGTPAAEAARLATTHNWEEVELALRQPATGSDGVVPALRGLALFVREDYKGAAAALQRAVAGDPGNALAAFFLGWAEDGAGNAPAALSAWRSAAHLDPKLVSAHIALADAYLRLSQPALAVQALRAGLAALPESIELRDRLARLEKPGGSQR